MYFCGKVLLPQVGEQDVVEVYGENLKEPGGASCVDGVAGVVHCCPGVGPRSQASVGKQVQHLNQHAKGKVKYTRIGGIRAK